MTKTTYAVYVDPAHPGIKFSPRIKPSYKTPKEAVRNASDLIALYPHKYRTEDFVFREEGKRPLPGIFTEKWKDEIISSDLFRWSLVISIHLAAITLLIGMIAVYVGGNAALLWNIGFALSAVIILVGLTPVIFRTLRGVRDYGGLNDYVVGWE